MTSSRPYFIRAIYQWLTDNNKTPYILVDAEYPGVEVPRQFVKDGRIVLNISPQAVNALSISNKALEFKARFGQVTRYIRAEMPAILAIYAKENGEGMLFDRELPGEAGEAAGEGATETDLKPESQPLPEQATPPKTPPKGRPHLRVIK